jgi:hypothetical protein
MSDGKNRLPAEVDVVEVEPANKPRVYPLPPQTRELFQAYHAQATVFMAKRDGLIQGIKATLGVPDSYGLNLQTLCFEQAGVVEPADPPSNGA